MSKEKGIAHEGVLEKLIGTRGYKNVVILSKAKNLSFSKSQLSKAKNGNPVSVESLRKMAALFEVKDEELFSVCEKVTKERLPGTKYKAIFRDRMLDQKTYFAYRDLDVPLLADASVIKALGNRYPDYQLFDIHGRQFPAVVLWENTKRCVNPQSILGPLESDSCDYLTSSALLNETEYRRARSYIKTRIEEPGSKIQYEGLNYTMTEIKLYGGKKLPKVHGALGWYYDNLLTQYAMEWELKKVLAEEKKKSIPRLTRRGTLPLRDSVESACNGDPLKFGSGRCASITISTLFVFARRHLGYYCPIRRRSMEVAVSPGLLHVVPAGMFEAEDRTEPWSVTLNVWREMMEELYDRAEQHGRGETKFRETILKEKQVKVLESMLKAGTAQHSVTGICCDLLNLRTEICTALLVKDPKFIEEFPEITLNWEYAKEGKSKPLAVPWKNIDQWLENVGNGTPMVVSGAVCFKLGREWVRSQTRF